MTKDVATTHRIAEIALGALKQIGLAATPQNIEVWCEHVEGCNPALSRDIRKVTDQDGKVSQRDAEKLHKEHVQRSDLSTHVIDIVNRFHDEVTDLQDMVEITGENAHGHSLALGGLSDQLRQSTEDYPGFGALLEGVLSVTKNIRAENHQLASRLAESVDEISTLQRSVESIQAEALKDSLTGIANRSMFDKTLTQKIAEATADGKELSLVIADIDHFKKFNDKWGHQTGDQVLRLVAEVMNANVKGQDLLARYGGEEFAVILPGTSLENARMLADRIRFAVESRRLKKRRTKEDLGVVTLSMGVALYRSADSMESLIERADQGLYAAKHAGRNQVIDETALASLNDAAVKGKRTA